MSSFNYGRLIFLGALLGACSAPVGEDVAVQQDELYGNSATYWPGARTSRVDINVCFEGPAGTFAAFREQTRGVVERNWGRYGRVNFNQWDACQAGGEPGANVILCSSLNPDIGCDAYPNENVFPGGRAASGVPHAVELAVTSGPNRALHEFGHLLGYYHENERPSCEHRDPPCDCPYTFAANSNPVEYGEFDPASVMVAQCGIPAFLSPQDIAGLQRSYGRRITGSLVSPRGNCVASHAAVGNGDGLFMWDCDEAKDDQEWLRTTVNTTQYKLYIRGPNNTTYCMGGAATGTLSNLMSCGTSDENRWVLQGVYVRGFGGMCLDLANGDTTDGTPIQMWACGALAGANQRWNLDGDGRLRYFGSTKCAVVSGGQLVIGPCTGTPFTFADQRIKSGSNCLDVRGPSDSNFTHGIGSITNGMRIQSVACNTSLNQQWNVTGTIRSGVANRCLTREAGSEANATRVLAQPCVGGSTAQTWDYYF